MCIRLQPTSEHRWAVELWRFTSRENNITEGMKKKTLPYIERENLGRNNVMSGHYQEKQRIKSELNDKKYYVWTAV